ncbi:MAG: alpha/beta fold hydrolase [Thermonemataceae bacterium]
MNYHNFYFDEKVTVIEVEDAAIALRKFGQGPPLVFIHGFFVYGYTWRKILPALAKRFTCYVIDLPGFGESRYSKETGFTFTAQARRLNKLFKILDIAGRFSIVAQDTGASIARISALEKSNTIEKLILINTEIPHHRPPFIPMYQFLAKLPGANWTFRTLLKFGFIVRSPLLLNQFFYDKSKLKDKSNLDHYVSPLKKKENMFGMLSYLKGIEWKVVDNFSQQHRLIRADTLLLWGEEDKTFPVKRVASMQAQFKGHCKLVRIPKACLMPHEERPDEVVAAIMMFLEEKTSHSNA